MKEVINFISNDQLEEAIELLSEISEEMDDTMKELILLKSRLTDVNRNYRKGIIKDDEKDLQKNKIRSALLDLTYELKKQISKINSNSNSIVKEDIDKLPYSSFHDKFRPVVDPYYIASSKSYIHVVFGSISDIKNTNVTVGCSQDFDLSQSSPRSALGSLWGIKINNHSLIDEVNKIWKPEDKPTSAGLGTSKYIKLPDNSNNLEGVIFTVTTRDVSLNQFDKGLYTDTPVEGIPIVLNKVFETTKEQKLSSIAIPLLGAGFANMSRTYNNPELGFSIEKTILAITIDESLNQLIGDNTNLRRIVVLIFSDRPQSEREHELWKLAIKMLNPNSERRLKVIDELINEIE
jgi:Effector-associated domain 11